MLSVLEIVFGQMERHYFGPVYGCVHCVQILPRRQWRMKGQGSYSVFMNLRVIASAFNDRGPLYMEQVLAAIQQGMRDRDSVTLAVFRDDTGIVLSCDVPPKLCTLVTTQLLAHYPSTQIERCETPAKDTHSVWTAELTLTPEMFPIKRYPQFVEASSQTVADPLSSILSTLVTRENDPLRPRLELQMRAAPHGRIHKLRQILRNLDRPIFNDWQRARYLRRALSHYYHWRIWAWAAAQRAGPLPQGHSEPDPVVRSHDRETAIEGAHDKLSRRLFDVQLRVSVAAPADQRERALAKLQDLIGALGTFAEPERAGWRLLSLTTGHGTSLGTRGFLLSAEELATLWHLPMSSLQVPTVRLAPYRQLEPPFGLPDPRCEQGIVTLGRTNFRDDHRPFGIRPDDRRRHLYVVGKTGMGKSTLLHNLLSNDITAGHGCCLVDPHGDLAEAVLATVPPQRTNDVILFDAGDQSHPLAFNPLADCDPQSRPLVASGMLAAFKKLYGDSWGPRLEHIFRNCLLALLETPGASLVSLVQLLGDAGYRHAIVHRVHDPVVKAFWLREFAGMPAKLQAEAIAPIQNKVGQFVSSPLLRHILGQSRSTIDLRNIMDRSQILIVNLSKGRVGEDASSLLGSLIITALQLAAMSRADVREDQRPDFHLYVDEFQHFATESFASVLSEARKYHLSLTLANQYLAQMDEATAAAVFGNVGSLVSFAVGADDAETLTAQLGDAVTSQDLLALPKYEAYVRLLIDGLPSRPFSLRTSLPSQRSNAARGDLIRRVSQRRYGRPLAIVAAEIERGFTAVAGGK